MNILENQNIKFDYAGLFEASEEWIHPNRSEETYEIIYVTNGTVHMHDEVCGDMSLEKGELVLLEPRVRHFGSKKSRGVSFFWVHFHIKDGALPFERRIFEKIDSPHLFRELLHYSALPEKPEYLINAILVRILSELCFISENDARSKNQLAEKIYEWVRINADAGLTVEKTAAHFGFTGDHISRIIKKHYGVGSKTLINAFTLSKAKELLVNTEKYVKEIAGELGFDDDKAFIGFFKYHEGVFPSEFRNRFYKIHMNKK